MIAQKTFNFLLEPGSNENIQLIFSRDTNSSTSFLVATVHVKM